MLATQRGKDCHVAAESYKTSNQLNPEPPLTQRESPEGTLAGEPEWVCVDLDGTLVRTDLLVEGLLSLSPTQALAAVSHLLKGRAAFKAFVAEVGRFDPALLPYNERLLGWLHEQKAMGRRLALVTAADRKVANTVAEHLRIFDEVIASDGARNLKGYMKAEALSERFADVRFTYVGDHSADLPVWQAAATRGLVNTTQKTRTAVNRLGDVEIEIQDRPNLLAAAIAGMRPHQWVKNLLVFVPVITAHALQDAASWAAGVVAFVAYSTCASGVYLANDLADLAADREHPRKRNRPLASGALPLAVGAVLSPLLLLAGITTGAAVGIGTFVFVYAFLSLSYALKLKEAPLVDVFVLAALYMLRLAGGGEATKHTLTLWLMAFSGFLFLSLALVKRAKEFTAEERQHSPTVTRRGYEAGDAPLLQIFGCASAFCSCVVLSLYVQNELASARYSAPGFLWVIVPSMLFWQCRLWLWTARGKMHDDPIMFAIRDWVSWLTGIVVLTAFVLAGPSFQP
jgi:4-hydroxybenzoate polyprenyltransferase/phosphoserine phosphatase